MIHTVICTDLNPNLYWQAELLEYSWSRVNQSGELLNLISCNEGDDLPKWKYIKSIRTEPTNIHPDSEDNYPPYNRLFSFRQWLDEYQPEGTVLILDPDMVFRKPLNIEVEEGKPIGQDWLDFYVSPDFGNAINKISDVDIGDLQPLTWPVLMDCQDLKKIISRWIDLTAGIRNHSDRWESDMFAFTVACHEYGLEFDLQTRTAWMPWPNEKVKDAALIHYCQKVHNKDGKELWWKQAYEPWKRLEDTQADQEYSCDLLRLINEYSNIQQSHNRTGSEDTTFVAIAAYCEPELISTIESCLNKARYPDRLRFGICLQYDDSDPLTSSNCLDKFSQDVRIKYVKYPFEESRGGCWARNIAQQLYDNERYTLQIDAHSQMLESWDVILINMMKEMPSHKPLITGFPPLYYFRKEKMVFQHIDDLSQVNTAFADSWNEDGSIHHPQKIIPENNGLFPRRTRFLSGAFVFTLGQWNEEVRQDPEHFYTGEEFALTIRSFTHGYDLFDPNQIVVWHRLHPEPNRKFWNDNEDIKVRRFHNRGVDKLRMLYEGDPQNELGRYGLGSARSLDEFHIYSGLDYKSYTMHPDVAKGIPPNPVTLTEHNGLNAMTQIQDEIVDVRINLKGMNTLELMCEEHNPILKLLFQSQMDKHDDGDSVIYLNMGLDGEEVIHFKKSSLIAIETTPPLSQAFFERLHEDQPNAEPVSPVKEHHRPADVSVFKFSDEWKYWIWNNIFERGVSKDLVFKELISHDIPWQAVRDELNHEPSIPLEFISSISEQERPNHDKQLIPGVKRISNEKIEIYSVDDFLTDVECEAFVSEIQSRQEPSKIVNEDKFSEIRTSQTCFFKKHDEEFTLAPELTQRISKLLGIHVSYAEAIQGHKYSPDEEYKPHVDWFPPGTEDFDKFANDEVGGQRTWSVLIYINDVEEGGATEFLDANLTIKPKRGKIVFWNNLLPSGAPNNATTHHGKPVISGEKLLLTQWFRSIGEGKMFRRDAQEYIPAYTSRGFYKTKFSKNILDDLALVLDSNPSGVEQSNDVLTNSESNAATDILEIPEELHQKILEELGPICEQWSGQSLLPTAIYGIRRYRRNTSLGVHRDRPKTHIISAILNVAQSVNEDWALEIEDHAYRTHQIVMQPGEMLLYEGGRLPHGRPTPLNGDYFCNVFVHFRPVNYVMPRSIPTKQVTDSES